MVETQRRNAPDRATRARVPRRASPERLLGEISRLLAERVDPDLLFRSMAEGLRELLIADRASLALYHADRDEFEIIALALHQGSRLGKGWTIPHRGSQVGQAFDSGEPLVKIHGLGRVLYEDRPLFEEGMQSGVVLPLVSDGRRIGTLNTDMRSARERTPGEIDCLVNVASQIASAVATSSRLALAGGESCRRRASGDGPARRFADVVARCPSLDAQWATLAAMAESDATILVTGETGTGKGVLARALHELGSRSAGPFLKCDCAALAPGLIEAELFGHERGAFTGAHGRRAGCFESAEGGTLFLDEVAELPLHLQAKLLGVLQDREVVRLGGTAPVPVDVRVIAATNRDLEAEVKAGTFREDLFYRLSAVSVFLPPLRKRRDDIDRIASHLLTGIAKETGRRVEGLAQEAAEVLRQQPWPGNVRELRNVLVRAAALSESSRIEVKDLFLAPKKTATLEGLSGRTLEEIEKAAIHATLKAADGNKTEAAKALGIAYSTLYEKMKKYGIRV
jgi:transcriptional regulator with GAF, ATPase, and Fis domain